MSHCRDAEAQPIVRWPEPKAVGLDTVVQEQARPAVRERLLHGRDIARVGHAEEAAAAAGAADFRGARARGKGARDQRLDHRRRHARRQLLARLPLQVDLRATPFQSPRRQRLAHAAGGVDDALETVEDVAIAVDVALRDLPVVRPREVRRARIGEHDAALQLRRIDVDRDALDAVRPQLDGRDAAVVRRPVVLQAGRHVDDLRLDVHGDRQELLAVDLQPGPFGERAAHGDVQRRRSGDARRRRATRRACEASGSRRGRNARACSSSGRPWPSASSCHRANLDGLRRVDRFQPDPAVRALDDLGVRAQADGRVHRLRVLVEQIQGPDVERAAGEIDSGWCRASNLLHVWARGAAERARGRCGGPCRPSCRG